jgi:hypothetical protein
VGEFEIQIFKLRELTRIEKRVCLQKTLHAWEFSQIFIQRSNENKSCVEVDTSRLDIPGKERKTLIDYIIKI